MNENRTRGRLVRSARKFFGEKGFRGACIREITADAGANLGAVTYHFGSKRGLYTAVLEELFDGLATRLERLAASQAPPPEAVRALIATLFAFFQESPDAPALILHQLTGEETIPEPVARHQRRVLAAVEQLVRAGQAEGRFRALDPVLVTFSIVSQSVWFALVGRVIGPVAFPNADHRDVARRIESHIADVVSRALAVEVSSA